jgi:hypothetical protein
VSALVNPVRERAIEELRRMVLAALGEHDAEVWLFGSCARGDRGQIGAEIEERLAGHAALLRRWLEALQRRATAE